MGANPQLPWILRLRQTLRKEPSNPLTPPRIEYTLQKRPVPSVNQDVRSTVRRQATDRVYAEPGDELEHVVQKLVDRIRGPQPDTFAIVIGKEGITLQLTKKDWHYKFSQGEIQEAVFEAEMTALDRCMECYSPSPTDLMYEWFYKRLMCPWRAKEA